MVGRPKMPAVQYPDPPPPAPERSTGETADLAAEQRRMFFKRGGRASTFLGASGGGQPASVALRFLGAAGASGG